MPHALGLFVSPPFHFARKIWALDPQLGHRFSFWQPHFSLRCRLPVSPITLAGIGVSGIAAVLKCCRVPKLHTQQPIPAFVRSLIILLPLSSRARLPRRLDLESSEPEPINMQRLFTPDCCGNSMPG